MAEITDHRGVLEKLQGFAPLHRVLLATAGTLQGTLSAYFGSPVVVDVVRQEDLPDGATLRDVELVCRERGIVACRASTRLTISDPEIARLIAHQQIGIGRILAMLGAEASFELEEVGTDERGFWRRYRLSGEGFCFTITEWFPGALYAEVSADAA